MLTKLTELLEYTFQDSSLLDQALTHCSLANESPEGEILHNERLEFLGDAVVDVSVGHQLMEMLPHAREGELTKLRALVVSSASLAKAAKQLELGQHLRLGRGEEHTGGRKKISILADTFEALIGAIFLDSGYAAADHTIRRVLGHMISVAVDGELDRDHKTILQEVAQGHLHQMPIYKVVAESGPDHAKVFSVVVSLNGRDLARADGHSKKAAEKRAARLALDLLDKEKARDTSC